MATGQSRQFADHWQKAPANYSESWRLHAFHPQSSQIMQNSLQNSSTLLPCFQISDYWQRTPRYWSKPPIFCAFCPQFLRTMQNLLNLHPWPAILSESSELQENTANDAKSAPSASTSGKSCEIHDICTQQSRKVMYFYTHVYAHIYGTYFTCMHTSCTIVD